MRIGIARIWQETSTFSPQPTDLELLRVYGVGHGAAALEGAGLLEEYVAGFLDVLAGHEVVGVTRVQAMPAGRLTAAAQEAVLSWFEEDLRRALPLDGLLLSLHGAFAGEANPDVEGLVAERARAILGPGVPIAAAMDLHGNITRRKVAHLDAMDALHTHPHVDSRQTGQRTASLLLRTVKGEVRPVMSAVKIPMITPAEHQLTALPPMSLLIAETRRQEALEGALLSSLFAVQPWLDVPELGWCSVVVTDGDPCLGDRLARQLAGMAWEQRAHYTRPCPTYREALDQAFASPARPVVISDLADLMTGGGTGDSTWYLRELLARRPAEPCYLTMVDPQAAAGLAAAGEGALVSVSLGGKLDRVHSRPVEVTGRVLRVIPPAPGRELPQSMGLTVTLRVGNVSVVVFEHLGPGSDPRIYSGAGLDPRQAKVLIAKSVVDFREGYRDVARLFLLGEAPGLAPSDLTRLSWEHAPRPLFPLDDGTPFAAASAPVYRSRPRRRQ
ncbi:MAG: M81 family metallopeptidase [Candidatus Latescibacterota bacterium]